MFSVLEESAQLLFELTESMFYEGLRAAAQVSCMVQMWKMPNVSHKLHVHHLKMNLNIKLRLFPQFRVFTTCHII